MREIVTSLKAENGWTSYVEHEAQKLNAWADDLKLAIERDIKKIDREIKEVRRTAAISPALEER
ncbi:MAG: hypothetical protein LBM17_00845 [Candidatus Accumulibacter sp.]|jgi:hypothetical protein|nr:hypothetical protein [Accumulibacter sp.]